MSATSPAHLSIFPEYNEKVSSPKLEEHHHGNGAWLTNNSTQSSDYSPRTSTSYDNMSTSSYKDGSSLNSPTGEGNGSGSGNRDLEAQRNPPPIPILSDTTGVEYAIPTHKKMVALGGYFLLSLGLTLQSKMILGKVCFGGWNALWGGSC